MLFDRAKDIAELLKVLSNENRLIIVCNLIEKPLNVTELHERISNITQSALSQHLAILRAHKIVSTDRKGLTITYSIKDKRIVELMKAIKENYCNE